MRSFQHIFPAFALALAIVFLLSISKANSQPADVEASASSSPASTGSDPAYLWTNLPFHTTINPATARQMLAILSRHLSSHPSADRTSNGPDSNTESINVVKTGSTTMTLIANNPVFVLKMLSARPGSSPLPEDLRPIKLPHSTARVDYYLCVITGKSARGNHRLSIDDMIDGDVHDRHTLNNGEEYCQLLKPDCEVEMTMDFVVDRLQVHRRLLLFSKHSVGPLPSQSIQYAVLYHPKQ